MRLKLTLTYNVCFILIHRIVGKQIDAIFNSGSHITGALVIFMIFLNTSLGQLDILIDILWYITEKNIESII